MKVCLKISINACNPYLRKHSIVYFWRDQYGQGHNGHLLQVL